MIDDNLDDVQQSKSVGTKGQYGKFNTEPKEYPKEVIEAATNKEITNYEKSIWNAAIEAAANVIDQCNREGPYQAIAGARRIRELKK